MMSDPIKEVCDIRQALSRVKDRKGGELMSLLSCIEKQLIICEKVKWGQPVVCMTRSQYSRSPCNLLARWVCHYKT